MKTVLLVDDNVDFLRATMQALAHDYDVIGAPDGTAARLLLMDRRVDAVVIDIVLPEGESGVDVARDLKRIASDLPIVAISGYVSPRITELAPSLFARYVQKPFTAADLREILRGVCAA